MIVIKGKIPSKKNSRSIFLMKGRLMNLPSKDYRDWHKQASQQLEMQKPSLFEEGLSKLGKEILIILYAHDLRKYDLTNKAESIMDLLVDCGFLEDDNYTCVSKITIQFGGLDRENPRAEIYG